MTHRAAICLSLALTLFMFVSMPVYSAEIEAKSSITKATVYANRATVTREASVSMVAGAQTIVFKNLPETLLTDSLRVEGSSSAKVTFGALSHKRVISKDLTSEREKELTDKIQQLTDQVSGIQVQKQALQARRNFIEALGKQAADRTNEEISNLSLNASSWNEAAAVIQDNFSEILASNLALDIQMRDVNETITALKRELNLSRTGQRSSFEVHVPLEAASAGTLKIALDYQVPNASWKPVYDARLETADASLAIVQYGAVRQNTGEDWSDIKLKLSTAQPHRGASLPDLTPMWVNMWDGSPRKQSRMMRSMGASSSNLMAADSMEMAYASAPEIIQEATFQAAEIETGGYVSEYSIPANATVLSDGSETKLMVGRFETDTALNIHVKPQLSNDAFLVAQTTLKGEAPLLPGQVSLFRDGAFVGQSTVPMLRAGESHALYFGVDDQVSVTRNVLTDERKDAGIISRDNELTRHYVTTIKNLHTWNVNMVVEETMPVAQNEKIEVEVLEKHTTTGYVSDYEDVSGLMRWEFDLGAGDETKVNLGWQVNWPKDHNLSGL